MPTNSTKAIVTCRGVTKTYKLGAIDVPALNGVDLDLLEGDFATLAGPSGSGKSTLLNLIGGLDQATTGEGQHRRSGAQGALPLGHDRTAPA